MASFQSGPGVCLPHQTYDTKGKIVQALEALGWRQGANEIQWVDHKWKWATDPDIGPMYNPMSWGRRSTLSDADRTSMNDMFRQTKQPWRMQNEPGYTTQANMRPSECIKDLIDIKKLTEDTGGIRYFGPGLCVNRDYPFGFFAEYVRMLRKNNVTFPEAWAFHFYNLGHGDGPGQHIQDAFRRRLKDVIDFMDKHGVNAAGGVSGQIILGEVSADHYWPDVQTSLMDVMIDSQSPGVHAGRFQGWDWFSGRYQHNAQSNLLNADYSLTPIGAHFKKFFS